MMKKVKCNACGIEYTDEGSLNLAEKWIEGGYAPCPMVRCRGELEEVCQNCGHPRIYRHGLCWKCSMILERERSIQ